MQRFDAIILGGGASGLYCAMHAARRGLSVAVADHSAKPARKVRISGGGKGNFTNLDVSPDNYLCANPHFVKSALARLSCWDVIDFFTSHGVTYEERDHGQLFTREGAGRLAGILAEQCTRLGVAFFLGNPVEVADGSAPFRVKTGADELMADKLVIALGGPSWPQAGASDFGFRLAERFGLALVRPRPGLVGLAFPKKLLPLCRDLSGNALSATVSTGNAAFTDPLLFTHTGISGPATLQASSYWHEGKPVTIDFLPGQPLADLIEANRTSNVQLKNLLARVLPKRLPTHLLPPAVAEVPASQLSKEQIEAVAGRVHRFTFTPAKTEGFAKAEVTVGGVDTDQISSKTFEAKTVPGLHVIGEALDVAGHLGGYNLHWAFASGAACGESL
jgi:hypothetical protein